MKKENYTRAEIMEIIDKEIKNTMKAKSDYIKNNGKAAYKHMDTLNNFSGSIAALTYLLSKF